MASDLRNRPNLDSAAELFAEHGCSGARMLDVAERLGISKSALYYRLASKEELLEGLVGPISRALAEFAAAAEPGDMAPERIIRGYLDHLIPGIPGLHPLLTDPGARAAIGSTHGLPSTPQRIEAALAASIPGPEHDRELRTTFALGGIRSVVFGRLSTIYGWSEPAATPRTPDGAAGPVLTDEEREGLVELALAHLGVQTPPLRQGHGR